MASAPALVLKLRLLGQREEYHDFVDGAGVGEGCEGRMGCCCDDGGDGCDDDVSADVVDGLEAPFASASSLY